MWLAFDIGTTGAKAALIDDNGTVAQSAYHGYGTHTGDGGIMEQHAPDWWQAVVEASQELNLTSVTGIAVTGQMQDVILLDNDGEPTHPVILYSDTRARDEAAAYTQNVDVAKLRGAAGNKQGEGADGLPAKLSWLAQHTPEALEKATHLLLGAADYVVYRMTGQTVTDSTTASTTGLMNMAARAPLDTSLLPESIHSTVQKLAPIVAGGTQAGTLSEKATAQTGIPAGTPVYIGPGDAGATTLGAGSGESGKVYAYLGTSGWVAFTSDVPADFESGVITIAHPEKGQHIQIAPLLTAGGNLDQALKMFNLPDYNTLIQQVADKPVNVLYLPYLNGERSPFIDPLARAAFIGMGANTDMGTLIRAVLTGVAYGYRHALDELMSDPLEALTITGGGTRSETWMQIFADVLNVPVQIAADAENVGVRGAVIAAGGMQGAVPIAQTLHPDDTHRAFYDSQYELFKQAYTALKPIFVQAAKG